MTNTKQTIKCDSTCLHSLKDQKFGFSGVKNTKWHKCQICDKWQVYNWIVRHQMHCEMSREGRIKCEAKGHYANNVHSQGVSCNLP
jgi:hypothetical protein